MSKNSNLKVEVSYIANRIPGRIEQKLAWIRKESGRKRREGQLQSIESKIAGKMLRPGVRERKRSKGFQMLFISARWTPLSPVYYISPFHLRRNVKLIKQLIRTSATSRQRQRTTSCSLCPEAGAHAGKTNTSPLRKSALPAQAAGRFSIYAGRALRGCKNALLAPVRSAPSRGIRQRAYLSTYGSTIRRSRRSVCNKVKIDSVKRTG